jgi:hypothetical protein
VHSALLKYHFATLTSLLRVSIIGSFPEDSDGLGATPGELINLESTAEGGSARLSNVNVRNIHHSHRIDH